VDLNSSRRHSSLRTLARSSDFQMAGSLQFRQPVDRPNDLLKLELLPTATAARCQHHCWRRRLETKLLRVPSSAFKCRHCGLARHFKTDPSETVALCFGYTKTPCLGLMAIWVLPCSSVGRDWHPKAEERKQ
jgi:hypothetical protein